MNQEQVNQEQAKLIDRHDEQQPIGEQPDSNKTTSLDMSPAEQQQIAMGKSLRMDVSHYLRMPEYQDKTLFWASTEGGDLERWLSLGAQPVRRVNRAGRIFKGLNDHQNTEYEKVENVSEGAGGRPVDNILLFLPDDDYERLRVEPNRNRNKEIARSMGMGHIPDGANPNMPGVTGLRSYAPYVDSAKTQKGVAVGVGEEITHGY